MWTDEWVGIPYAKLGRGPDGFDCLGLFVTLQKLRHGRAVFDPLCTVGQAARHAIADREKLNWTRVACAEEGDALLFRVKGLQLHIAYALPSGRMLHSSADLGESALECVGSSLWAPRLEGIYRHAG
jgi:probable lipoprotein NlpC